MKKFILLSIFLFVALFLFGILLVEVFPQAALWLIELNTSTPMEMAKSPYFKLLWYGLILLFYLYYEQVVRKFFRRLIRRNPKFTQEQHEKGIERVIEVALSRKWMLFTVVAFIEIPKLLSMVASSW